MILEYLKTQRKITPTPFKTSGAYDSSDHLSQTEYLNRDRLIKKLYSECPYKFGDLVRANDDKDFKKEGLYKITGVCSGWYVYKGAAKTDKEVEWSENPRIVTAMNVKTGAVVEATVNYFRKATDEEAKTIVS